MGKKNKIEDIIKKAIKEATKETAEELTFMIEKEYEHVIDEFYNDYEPSWYDRTFSTYLASDRYDSVYDKPMLNVGDSYWAGINVSSNNIPGNPYKAHKFWVFDRTFRQGIHGYTMKESKLWSNRKHNSDYGVYFKFKTGENSMSKMKQPPKEMMDKWFRHELTTMRGHKKIDSIFSDNLTNKLSKY